MAETQQIQINGTGLGSALTSILEAGDIEPGDEVSYQAAKAIYLYHPLGKRIVDGPIELAQSKSRETSVKEHPDEVKEAFDAKAEEMGIDGLVFNEHHTARLYGISTLVAVMDGLDPNKPLDMKSLYKNEGKLKFNVLDPLNTAGSLVLSQIPTDADFQKPISVSAGGKAFHRSRWHVTMNEMPIYLAYSNSAFGFVGRSVFQRTLYPLKSFLQTMRSDDVISGKLSMIVYKAKSPGSIISAVMQTIGAIKRSLIKYGRNGNVLTIGKDEEIETLDMQNVHEAGTFARNNILKNIATGSPMPAQMLNEETLVSGLADGTEDAKIIARYGEHFRMGLIPSYKYLDNFCMYLAWNEEFFKRMQTEHPKLYGKKTYEEVFADWRASFSAQWPSLLQESEAEKSKIEQVKIEQIIGLLELLLDRVDPETQIALIQWAADNLNESKLLLPHELEIDWDALESFLDDENKLRVKAAKKALTQPAMAQGKPGTAKPGVSGAPKPMATPKAARPRRIAA